MQAVTTFGVFGIWVVVGGLDDVDESCVVSQERAFISGGGRPAAAPVRLSKPFNRW
jgi:hypothetical protein